MLRHLILLVAVASVAMIGQPSAVRPNVEKPPTPSRIRLGCNVQAAYLGPASQWHNYGPDFLSDSQIADLERKLATDPEDICARGYLIAHGGGRVAHRTEHVLWMIQHHPEWDGFLLNLSGSRDPRAASAVTAAWLQQIRSDPASGSVLHNASIFFEESDPDFAETLLERAIQLEPDVAFHVEGLGALYGRSQVRLRDWRFSIRAKSILESSSDWLIVAGAINTMERFKRARTDFDRMLEARLRGLTRSPNLNGLPSRSTQYTHARCDVIPLLHRCIDDTRISESLKRTALFRLAR